MKHNSSEILKAFYDKTSIRFGDPLRGLQGRDKVVFPLIPDGSGTFLEYGFGSGSLLFEVADKLHFNKLIGFDISSKCIDNANFFLQSMNEDFRDRIRLLIPENDRIPQITDRSVNMIVCVATIQLVLNPYIVLDEFYRVATEDATLVCSIANYAYIKHRVELLFGKLPKTATDSPVEKWREAGWDGMCLHTFTAPTFDVLLRDCGWKPVLQTGWGGRFPIIKKLREKLPSLFSGEIIAVCKKRGRSHVGLRFKFNL